MKIINNLEDIKSLNKDINKNIKKTNKSIEKISKNLNISELKKKDEAKTKIIKFIMYKKRTEQEIRNKFKNEIEQDILNEIIEYLKEAKYIDDNDFIHKKVNEFMNLRTMSIKEIKYKLIEKGFDRKLVEQYIEDNIEKLDNYEKKCIEKIRTTKSKSMNEDKIKQYLFRKGYKLNKF